ncbi:breast cancer type 2 susceptibility protein [Elysia marginata]|uniref:Breast cancer type 2 susceptibility protein n=1 Tax=Elysia marginata TaxID=1093978 RepID=A0AAV4H4Q9_9GAST|nr:breast cancer type 2 susceptibility protein [Elysia marginata]
MDLCKCCKVAHKNLLFSHLASCHEENLLSEAVLEDLGDTSLSWFEDLTETFLSTASSREKDESISLSNVEKIWSPCPRGGVATVRGQSTSGAVETTSPRDLPELGVNNRSSSCGDLCTSNADLSWTSAMATPLDAACNISYFYGDNSTLPGCGTQTSLIASARSEGSATALRTPSWTEKKQDTVKPKVLSRMLFSPGQKSLSNDSLSATVEWSLEADTTVEQEETICSESDVKVDNSLNVTLASNQEPLEHEQDTLTAKDTSVCLTTNQSVSEPSRFTTEDESDKKKDLGISYTMGMDLKNITAEMSIESEFSDSFTAEEMEMIEDDYIKQSEELSNMDTQLVKVDVTSPTAKKEKKAVNDSQQHSHVESVLAMIFPSQGNEDSSDQKENKHLLEKQHSNTSGVEQDTEDQSKENKMFLGGLASVNCKNDLTNKVNQNHVETTTTPTKANYTDIVSGKDINCINKEEKLCDLKETSTPQSILKHLQTPRSSVKKRVRFSIKVDSSSSSHLENGVNSLADMLNKELPFHEDVSSAITMNFNTEEIESEEPSQVYVMKSEDDSRLQSQSLYQDKEVISYKSQSECVLVSSQIEDISSLYPQGGDSSLFRDDHKMSSQITQECCPPTSRNVIDTEMAEAIHSVNGQSNITTMLSNDKFQNNLDTSEFVFDDLSPPLSPAFPSQVLSVHETLDEEEKRPEFDSMKVMAENASKEVTVTKKSGSSNTGSLLDSNIKSDIFVQEADKTELKKLSKNVTSQNVSGLTETKSLDAPKSAASICILEDGDDEIMCAVAISTENNPELTHQNSSDAAVEKQTSHVSEEALTPTTYVKTDNLSYSKQTFVAHTSDSASKLNLTTKPPEVTPVVSKSSITESLHSPGLNPLCLNTKTYMTGLPSTESSLKTITPFAKSKSRKFLYPTSVQKQPALLNKSEKITSPPSSGLKQQGDCTTPTTTTEKSPSHGITENVELPIDTRVSNEFCTEPVPFIGHASHAGEPPRDCMDKADLPMWSSGTRNKNQLQLSSRRQNTLSRLNKKSDEGYLGFAKFSDVFQDTEEPTTPPQFQETTAVDSNESRKLRNEDSSFPPSDKTTLSKKTEDMQLRREKTPTLQETFENSSYGNCEDHHQLRKDSEPSYVVKQDSAKEMENESENLIKQGREVNEASKTVQAVKSSPSIDDEILEEEFGEDFTSQMWTATEFSQIVCCPDDDIKIMQHSGNKIAGVHAEVNEFKDSPDIGLDSGGQDCVFDTYGNSKTEGRTFAGKSAELPAETPHKNSSKKLFGFSSAASVLKNFSDESGSFSTGLDSDADLESQLENVIKAKKGFENREEHVYQTSQYNKATFGAHSMTVYQKGNENVGKLDVLEDQLEHILQSRRNIESSAAKKSYKSTLIPTFNSGTHSSSSTSEVSAALPQGGKAREKRWELDKCYVARDIGSSETNPVSLNLSNRGFTTAAGKDINLSAAAQNKAWSLWDSVSKELDPAPSGKTDVDSDCSEVKFKSKCSIAGGHKQEENIQPVVCGFTTAAGKDISMSVAAEVKAKKLWESVLVETAEDSTSSEKFSMPSLCTKHTSREAIKTNGNLDTSFFAPVSKLDNLLGESSGRLHGGDRQKVPDIDKRHKGFQPFKAPKIVKSRPTSTSATTKAGSTSLQVTQNQDDKPTFSTNIGETCADKSSLHPHNVSTASKVLLDVDNCIPEMPNKEEGESKKDAIVVRVQEDEEMKEDSSVSACALGDNEATLKSAVHVLPTSSNHSNISKAASFPEAENTGLLENDKCNSLGPQSLLENHVVSGMVDNQNNMLSNQHLTDTKVVGKLATEMLSVAKIPEKVLSFKETVDFSDSNLMKDCSGKVVDMNKMSPCQLSSSKLVVSTSLTKDIKPTCDIAQGSRNINRKEIVREQDPPELASLVCGYGKVFNNSENISQNATKVSESKITTGPTMDKDLEYATISRKFSAPISEEVPCQGKTAQEDYDALFTSKPSSVGFSTASDQTVSVSEKSLTHARRIFNDEAGQHFETKDNTMLAKLSLSEVSTASDKFASDLEKATSRDITFPEDCVKSRPICDASIDLSIDKPKSLGFSTASGKAVSVSKRALCRARTFLNDDAQNICDGEKKPSVSSSKCLEYSTSSDDLGTVLSEMVTCHSTVPEDDAKSKSTDKTVPNSMSLGFSTASGKLVTVSEKALSHAKTVLEQNAQEFNETKETPGMSKPCSFEFSKPAGKLESVPNKALCDPITSADYDFNQSCHANVGKTESKPRSFGFSTASGKSVAVSKKALSHARTFLKDSAQEFCASGEDHNVNIPNPSDSGFSTASGKSVSVSEKALSHAKTFLDNVDQNYCATEGEPDKSICSVSGFSTASGKSVSVSEKALCHLRTFLDDDANDVCEIKTENRSNVSYSSSSGFSTASGQSVAVTDKALCHAKRFLDDSADVSCNASKKMSIPKPSLSGFSTAAGKSVSVSDKALHQPKSMLENSDECVSVFKRNSDMTKIDITAFCTSGDPQATKAGNSSDNSTNPGPQLVSPANTSIPSLGSSRVKCQEETDFRYEKDAIKAAPNDRPVMTLRKHLTPQGAKCDEFQYDRSNPKMRKLRAMSSTKYLEEKSVAVSPLTNENKAPTSFKPPYKKVKPDASGDCSSPLQGHDQNLKHNNVKGSSFVPPPVVKTTPEHQNLGLGDLVNTKQLDRKAKPVFGPLKSGLAVSHDLTSLHLVTEQKDCRRPSVSSISSPTLPPATNLLAEESSREHNKANDDGLRCEDLDNEAENELLCSDFYGPYKKGSDEGSVDAENKKASMTNTSSLLILNSAQDGSHKKRNEFVCEESVPGQHKSLVAGSYQVATSKQWNLKSTALPRGVSTSDNGKTSNMTCQGSEKESSHIQDAAICAISSTRSSATPVVSSTGSKGITGDTCERESSFSKPDVHVNASMISSLEFEEAVMAQEKMIRNKKRRKVQPCCGRWLEIRKKGGSKGKPLLPLSSLDQESKQSFTYHELLSMGVCPSTLAVNSLNAKDYRFNISRYFPATSSRILVGDGALLVPDLQGFAGEQEFYKAFLTLEGVDPLLCDQTWLKNHYRWLVWKLAAYEICWPIQFAGRCLTPDLLMLQLKYRYDREVDACHRSAIKKIVERDDTPSKRMVLCVASIDRQASAQPILELTDGWYSIRAQIDSVLSGLVSSNRLRPGVKIITSGAELVGGHGACSPLEIPDALMLKLSGNSTRPARWLARLGYCAPSAPMCMPLVSLAHGGGTAGCVDVVLSRKYPTMFMEKLPDGACIFRTLEEEEKANRKHEEKRQEQIEKLYSALQTAKEKESSSTGGVKARRLSKKEIEQLWSGQELAEAMESALNPEDFQQCLSTSQVERLSEFKRVEADRRQHEINLKLQEAMSEAGHVRRNVVPVKKFRVHGCCRTDIDSKSSKHKKCCRKTLDAVDNNFTYLSTRCV